MKQPDLKRISYHEAGHAVVMHAYGFAVPFMRCKVGVSHTAIYKEVPESQMQEAIKHLICVAYAGILAERMVYGDSDEHGSKGDIAKIDSYFNLLKKQYALHDRQTLDRDLQADVETILRRQEVQFRSLAQELFDKGELSSEDVRRIIEKN